MANQRIRDPLHDIVEFDSSELERTLWKVIQTRPFQRLRRVKQLGFSDLVYPGATHSRFAHSIGVFHTARQLMQVVHRHVKEDQTSKEHKALAAALVHDLGHGPLSHAFEKVGSRLDLQIADHETMSDALIRGGEVADVFFKQFGRGFADEVADIIKKDGAKTVHHAVVSSQFDADRLDYMRRDRMMAGSQHAAIDFSWLITNLEVGSVATGVDDSPVGMVETFVLGPKAIHAAEAFVLGLFQLYPTIYFHKATRGAEKLFVELLVHFVRTVRNGDGRLTGLSGNHPLVAFANNPDSIEAVLALDDATIWGALTQMSEAEDALISEFSARLRDRKLYKCHDIRQKVAHIFDPNSNGNTESLEVIDRCCSSISGVLEEWSAEKSEKKNRVLMDNDERSPYKPIGQSKGPLDSINIRTDGGALVDIKERSSVVAALKTFKLSRAYVDRDDHEAQSLVNHVVDEEIVKCRTGTH